MTAPGSVTNIFECSLCPQILFATPEDLCQHMKQYHDMRDMEVQSIFFSDRQSFQNWLKTVEDGRGQPSGYVQGAVNPFFPTTTFQDEYYLLCKKKYCTLKRRRLSGEQQRDSSTQQVVCAAFVHVIESSNGSVWVRFCLEHCGHPLRPNPSPGAETSTASKPRTSQHLKRNSSSTRGDSEDEDYESEETMEEGPQAAASSTRPVSQPGPSSKPTLPADLRAKLSTHRRAVLSSVESELASAKASVSSIKESVTENIPPDVYARLQVMANQLRTVTQVLSDLAVDVSPAGAYNAPMDL